MFNPAKDYENSVIQGIYNSSILQKEAYNARRNNTIESEKQYSVILSPSKSSFFLDIGNGYKQLQGNCIRKSYFENKIPLFTVTDSADSIRKMEAGQVLEEKEHEYEKLGGILITSNYRMNMEVDENVVVSGEVDSIVKLSDEKYYVAEIKTYDGYTAKKNIRGNTKQIGMPKYDHIAQNMLYLSMIMDNEKLKEEHGVDSIEGTIFNYIARSDLLMTTHNLKLDIEYDNAGKLVNAYPIINNQRYTFVSMRELITRSLLLSNYIIKDIIPPREPDLEYDDDKVEYMREVDLIPKTNYSDWQKGNMHLGDWQCREKYCPYHKLCYGNTPYLKESWPKDDEIQRTINNSTNKDTGKENQSKWD